ncbi:ATP11-domain-containing protein [Echria macrotheca]|uniref:ATP11-domain-containing protein n=1 Tax=Echria macrotheca TaxID=438768 RepID=A0AAJ0F9F2_9PEZI|nr:ATP11-domain-containing protein [Echria macrotheca]
MATVRTPALRHLAGIQARLTTPQRRWAQVHDVRFLATTQHRRSVIEKYRDKLDRKARAEGHADIDALKRAYADKIASLRREADVVVPPPPPPSPTSTSPSRSSGPSATTETATKKSTAAEGKEKGKKKEGAMIKPLSEIINLPKLEAIPSVEEITSIWRDLHSPDPRSLAAVIPAATFEHMSSLARTYPQFLLPVPHDDAGAEMHFLQWTWDAASRTSTVLFTQLAEYKARGEYAAPHTTVTHYLDLVDTKGVVLMHGLVAGDRGVRTEDARWLVMCLQRFYGGWEGKGRDEERRRLLEWFGRGDERFSVEKLLEEAERMG